MNKILKVTLITAIMATSGMCGGYYAPNYSTPNPYGQKEMTSRAKDMLIGAAAGAMLTKLCGDSVCQCEAKFDALALIRSKNGSAYLKFASAEIAAMYAGKTLRVRNAMTGLMIAEDFVLNVDTYVEGATKVIIMPEQAKLFAGVSSVGINISTPICDCSMSKLCQLVAGFTEKEI